MLEQRRSDEAAAKAAAEAKEAAERDAARADLKRLHRYRRIDRTIGRRVPAEDEAQARTEARAVRSKESENRCWAAQLPALRARQRR